MVKIADLPSYKERGLGAVVKAKSRSLEITSSTSNVGVMLFHRLRRWPNIKPPVAEHVLCEN